jgi:hypothetical protein
MHNTTIRYGAYRKAASCPRTLTSRAGRGNPTGAPRGRSTWAGPASRKGSAGGMVKVVFRRAATGSGALLLLFVEQRQVELLAVVGSAPIEALLPRDAGQQHAKQD